MMIDTIYSFKTVFSIFMVSWLICSCAPAKLIDEVDKRKSTLVIRIRMSNPVSHKLTMFDEYGRYASTFVVWSGQYIKWNIQDSDIKSFTDIKKKAPVDSTITDSTKTIYFEKPAKLSGAKDWKGKVKETTVELEEEYFILWQDKNGVTHTYDPFIQVRPQ